MKIHTRLLLLAVTLLFAACATNPKPQPRSQGHVSSNEVRVRPGQTFEAFRPIPALEGRNIPEAWVQRLANWRFNSNGVAVVSRPSDPGSFSPFRRSDYFYGQTPITAVVKGDFLFRKSLNGRETELVPATGR